MSGERRVLCPFCHYELLHAQDGPLGDAFVYATLQQMRERRLTCDTIFCPIYIEGQPHLSGWGVEDETLENQHRPNSTNRKLSSTFNHRFVTRSTPANQSNIFLEAENGDGTGRQTMDARVNTRSNPSVLASNQEIIAPGSTKTCVTSDQQFQQTQVDGSSDLHSDTPCAVAGNTTSSLHTTGAFTTGPADPAPFLGAAPFTATGRDCADSPHSNGTGYSTPMPGFSPLHIPGDSSSPSSNTSPVPVGFDGAGTFRQGSTQVRPPRASIRNRYTAHEVAIIMQMKSQGRGNDEIAKVLPRHTARSIEAKFAALTKGRPRSQANVTTNE